VIFSRGGAALDERIYSLRTLAPYRDTRPAMLFTAITTPLLWMLGVPVVVAAWLGSVPDHYGLALPLARIGGGGMPWGRARASPSRPSWRT